VHVVVMPMKREKYPDNWDEIAAAIKEATGWKCQSCGKQCYLPGVKVSDTRFVLTVAHVNHVESDCRPENLVAACSVCHLRYDAERKRWQQMAKKRIKSEANNELFRSA
jgi:5-methylcytosine-specific restriction endonuclease McrA